MNITNLEKYAIFEKTLISFIKNFSKYLIRHGYKVAHRKDYSFIFETIFHEQYPSEDFIKESPEDSYNFGETTFSGGTNLLFVQFFRDANLDAPIVGITIEAHLTEDDVINLHVGRQYNDEHYDGSSEYLLKEWPKLLDELSDYLLGKFE
jgi:hypothetical protein